MFEETLLRNLRSRQSDLTALLENCSSRWGFEDPICRFYHQSFKVYSIQGETARIVHALESLAPERPLKPWFRQIIEQGTARSSRQADNQDWPPAARPILEAFFHARFFLEMAVRYARLP